MVYCNHKKERGESKVLLKLQFPAKYEQIIKQFNIKLKEQELIYVGDINDNNKLYQSEVLLYSSFKTEVINFLLPQILQEKKS